MADVTRTSKGPEGKPDAADASASPDASGGGSAPAPVPERYRVETTIGGGGMGTVFGVTDTVTGRQVALKQLRTDVEDPDESRVALFHREFQTLQQLAHPRIIRVYEYGVGEAGPYYTMEWLDGQDMSELAPLPVQRACELLRDVASSLAIIHSRGLVYRDLSQRNVRCTSDGRAKLIDFGALTPMGTPRLLVGTPSFVAPEVVFGQPLDQRSDLYSLGVLAYWLLTDKLPFQARRLGDLRNAWRTRPAPPSSLSPDVPKAFDSLVLSLLSVTPAGRPQTAGEVIDKLSAIGRLPRDPELGVVRAYLTTPELVGRDDELLRVRKAVVRAARGRGGAFLVRGDAGAGRSRLLDAAVLEGQLVGAAVARAQPGGTEAASFGAVRSVVEQWSVALSESDGDSLKGSLATALEGDGDGDYGVLLERLATVLLTAARRRALMLTLDDAQRVDTPSLAVFALVAKAARHHKLVMVASLATEHELMDSVPLRMLGGASKVLELAPWSGAETEALLRSIFGNTSNVSLLADRIHRVALGNPRHTLQLAKHVVDTGVVRHRAGAWVLPSVLDEVAVPETMAQAHQQLVNGLDPQARELAETLALAPNLRKLTLADVARLFPDALLRLNALVEAGVLVEQAAGFAFRHQGVAEALLSRLDGTTRATLHLSLVAMHRAADDHPLTIAYHLDRADRPAECLEFVLPWLRVYTYGYYEAHQVEVLERVVEDGARYPIGVKERHRLRCVLALHACVFDPSYGHYGEASFEQLRKDSGLIHYDDFIEEDDPTARIGRCLERAQARYEATPEAERGFAPVEAIRELAFLVRSMTSVYSRTLEADKLMDLGKWLLPFRTLVPIMDLLYELTVTAVDRAVHEKDVADRFRECARRFAEPMDGVDAAARQGARGICIYCAAMDGAKQGKPSAVEEVESLYDNPRTAALAWHVRMLHHLYTGHMSEARACRDRMELLVIQQDEPNTLVAMSVLYEAWAYEMCEDLAGMNDVLERVNAEAARYPGWRPWAKLYGGDVHRLRGEVEQALAAYEEAAAMVRPGRHQVWPHSRERRITALRLLGRLDEALELAEAAVADAERAGQEPVNLIRLYVAKMLVEGQLGQGDAAQRTAEVALACIEREGIAGVARGIFHEAQARLAIWADDAAAFAAAAEHGRAFLLAGDSAALTAKYERLRMEAREVGLEVIGERPRRASDAQAVVDALAEASDPAACAAVALEYLVEQHEALGGYLFEVTHEGPALISASVDVVPSAIHELVAEYLTAELTETEMVTVTRTDELAATGVTDAWTFGRNDRHAPLLLQAMAGGEMHAVAIAVLRFGDLPERSVDLRLGQTVGQALFDAGLAKGQPIAC